MTIDYDKLRRELGEIDAGVHVTTRYTWADLARELLRLHDDIEGMRAACHLSYAFCRQVDTPEHKAVGENLKEVRNQLEKILDGDTE